MGEPLKDLTHIGYVQGTFKNEDQLNDLKKVESIESFYNYMNNQVNDYYGV